MSAVSLTHAPVQRPLQLVQPMRSLPWHDFRVDMDWRTGGLVQFYVDGQMFHQATLSGATANCHWDERGSP
jgi:hypothetical protein